MYADRNQYGHAPVVLRTKDERERYLTASHHGMATTYV